MTRIAHLLPLAQQIYYNFIKKTTTVLYPPTMNTSTTSNNNTVSSGRKGRLLKCDKERCVVCGRRCKDKKNRFMWSRYFDRCKASNTMSAEQTKQTRPEQSTCSHCQNSNEQRSAMDSAGSFNAVSVNTRNTNLIPREAIIQSNQCTMTTMHDDSSLPPVYIAAYEGEYNENGEYHGHHSYIQYSNGDTYDGSVQHGRRNGHGVFHDVKGGEYVGSWENDYRHGLGTNRYANGNVYVGNFVWNKRETVSDAVDRQHNLDHLWLTPCPRKTRPNNASVARMYYSNGDLYVGEWKDDTFHGPGKIFFADGSIFSGNFHRGLRHGLSHYQKQRKKKDDQGANLVVVLYINNEKTGTGVEWNKDRTKAWRINHGTKLNPLTRISVAEAVSATYELEREWLRYNNVQID